MRHSAKRSGDEVRKNTGAKVFRLPEFLFFENNEFCFWNSEGFGCSKEHTLSLTFTMKPLLKDISKQILPINRQILSFLENKPPYSEHFSTMVGNTCPGDVSYIEVPLKSYCLVTQPHCIFHLIIIFEHLIAFLIVRSEKPLKLTD